MEIFCFYFQIEFFFFSVEPVGKNGARRITRNNSKNKPHELDQQGLVPLPAKNCFSCRRSCKKAPLVACDYCPLFFHQDCLNPPLTALPAGMWMCPNHPEQFIVSRFLIFMILMSSNGYFLIQGLETCHINISD